MRDAMLLEMPDADLAKTRTMCEPLIDCEKDKVLWAVLEGMWREGD